MTEDLDLAGTTAAVMSPGGLHAMVAASSAAIRAWDALQFDCGQGPSREAFDAGRPVLVSELGRTRERWPGLASAGTESGICAVYAFPLQVGAVRLGVLTGYSGIARTLTRPELGACAVYADVATELLLDTASGQRQPAGPETFLQNDLQVRDEVYQAQGMVMVDLGVPLVEALARLRGLAFAEGLALDDLAAQVVAGRQLVRDDTPAAEPDSPPDA